MITEIFNDDFKDNTVLLAQQGSQLGHKNKQTSCKRA